MSNGYNFTERVRKVLAMSREESSALHHEYVGTEHILLGLLAEGEGVASAVMQSLHVDLDKAREDVLLHLKRGNPERTTGPDLPYTSRAKKVLELSMSEARDCNHSYVGTEHLLLGLLREERGIAAQVLTNNGLTLARARAETLRILGNPDVAGDASRFSDYPPGRSETRSFKRVTAVFVDIQFEDGSAVRKEFANAAWAMRYLESM